MKIYAITLESGQVAIMRMQKEGLNVEDEIARWPDPSYVSYVEITEEDIPKDRVFRDALKVNDNKIEHDISKAHEIKKDELRRLRKPKLEALDIEQMRATEENDTEKLEVIAKKKQVLRDITKRRLPKDIKKLAKHTPKELK